MRNRIVYIAWASLLFALLAWCEVGYFAYTVTTKEADREAGLSSLNSVTAKEYSAAQITALESSTADSRAALQAFTQVDPVALAALIESGGKSIGVTINLSNALPQSQIQKTGLNVLGFTTQTQGSFASLIRVAEMLEELPAPSSIQALNLAVVPNAAGAAAAQWNLQVQMRVLTTTPVSS